DIRHRMRAALVADQKAIALRVVACALCLREHLHKTPIGTLPACGGDACGDDGRARVLADMDHLGPGIGLLEIVGNLNRVEFADRVVALENAAWILPGDRRAGLDLRP